MLPEHSLFTFKLVLAFTFKGAFKYHISRLGVVGLSFADVADAGRGGRATVSRHVDLLPKRSNSLIGN